MVERTLAIRLKIPDNEAFTALRALQRLGVEVARMERSDVLQLECLANDAHLVDAVQHNETLFNPNKHEIEELAAARPRQGELWIEELGEDPALRGKLGGKAIEGVLAAKRYTGWRLFDQQGNPATAEVLERAASVLLCNPAIERAIL